MNNIEQLKNAITNNTKNIELYNTNIYYCKENNKVNALKTNRKALRKEKKLYQKNVNDLCIIAYNQALTELNSTTPSKKLRYCAARVYETKNYYLLKSYNTFIACIDKKTNTLYDCLRIVYGYTSTSAHHISKFNYDYKAGKYGCKCRYTAR